MADRWTNRMEAFSDGVFAIAITLLILEIHVPKLPETAGSEELFSSMAGLWPSFLAFLLSFFAILIMWVSHHELIRMVRKVDYHLLFANGLLLLMVTFVPFPTAVLAQHLGTKAGNAATLLYCVSFFVTAIAFILLWWPSRISGGWCGRKSRMRLSRGFGRLTGLARSLTRSRLWRRGSALLRG
ncbi:MAG TPA: TMEM175 family protein [Bryobacteraceae bacterium]|nr:TMEM175 family protein [Bryobacteraceae bacterium]